MTVYYVSKQRGNDLNDGRSPSTPWASITKAVQTLVAGDTCYIGPGTYREKPTNANAGTSGNLIQFIGDPDAMHVVGDTPGIVRVTACDEYEMIDTTSYTLWVCNKNYVKLKNMMIDGCWEDIVVFYTPTNRFAENIVAVGGGWAFSGGTLTNCIALGAYSGIAGAKCVNCISIGGGESAFEFSEAINCLAIGGMRGFIDGTAVNCMSIGGNYGFSVDTAINCIALGSRFGYVGGNLYNSLAMNCFWAFTSSAKVNDCKYNLCRTISDGSITTDPGYEPPAEAPITLWTFNQMQKILEAFDPWMFEGAKQGGRITDGSGNPLDLPGTDILGRARKMLGGGLDIGPYAFSNVEPDFAEYRTNPPGIKIQQKGMKMFEIPATGGEEITVKVQVKYTNPMAGLPPRIFLRGETITEQMAQYTAGSNVWQELTVSATPEKDEILTLVLCAEDMGAGSVSYFSDIRVS